VTTVAYTRILMAVPVAQIAKRALAFEFRLSPGTGRTHVSTPVEPERAARLAGLRYVTDAVSGITRRRAGRGFTYRDPRGERIDDPEEIARIKQLAVPPAWEDVWICTFENGHLQATGRDARRRKQYRYHPEWSRIRNEGKFDRVVDFGLVLPDVRARVDADLGLPGVQRDKVLTAVLRLLDMSLMRVGNSEYARLNDSFGATTIHNDHAEVKGQTISFHFTGKSGKQQDVRVVDRRIARVVQRCQELSGQELFAYVDDDGAVRDVGSADVNDYLRESAGEGYSAKDFRTFGGTVQAAESLALAEDEDEAVPRAIAEVASELGNTPAVARASYIHPAVLAGYEAGTLPVAELREALDEGGGRLTEELVIEYLRNGSP
jgi:DNA topoisomerase I